MDRRAVAFLHLIEFVNTAEAHIGENKRTTFQCHVIRDCVPHHRRRETCVIESVHSCELQCYSVTQCYSVAVLRCYSVSVSASQGLSVN